MELCLQRQAEIQVFLGRTRSRNEEVIRSLYSQRLFAGVTGSHRAERPGRRMTSVEGRMASSAAGEIIRMREP